MAQIQFKAKVKTMYNIDDSIAYTYISVPELTTKHCNMADFRCHPKYGPYANSDLFKSMLRRIRKSMFKGGVIKLHQIPEGVQIDTSGFLAVASFDS